MNLWKVADHLYVVAESPEHAVFLAERQKVLRLELAEIDEAIERVELVPPNATIRVMDLQRRDTQRMTAAEVVATQGLGVGIYWRDE